MPMPILKTWYISASLILPWSRMSLNIGGDVHASVSIWAVSPWGNIPRILPQGLTAQIDTDAWTSPPIFKLIRDQGKIKEAEMYQVFNMGIGMVIICSPQRVAELTAALPEIKKIGKVIKSTDSKKITII